MSTRQAKKKITKRVAEASGSDTEIVEVRRIIVFFFSLNFVNLTF
jgi:hypothetical protein